MPPRRRADPADRLDAGDRPGAASSGGPRPGPGRPRSAESRGAVLDAAWALLADDGLRALSMEAIAARAGVGKSTVYRWWASKTAVLADALAEHFEPVIAFPDTGSVREDLRQQLHALIRLFGRREGDVFLTLVAESRHDPELARALSERYIAGRRALAIDVVRRGIDRGELRADLDPGLVIDTLYGAVYYRFLVSREATDAGYAEAVLDVVLGSAGVAGVAGAPGSASS